MHKFGLSSITTSHISKNTRKTIHPVCIYIIITLCWLKKKIQRRQNYIYFYRVPSIYFLSFNNWNFNLQAVHNMQACTHSAKIIQSVTMIFSKVHSVDVRDRLIAYSPQKRTERGNTTDKTHFWCCMFTRTYLTHVQLIVHICI